MSTDNEYQLTEEDRCPCVCDCKRGSLEGLCTYCVFAAGLENHGYGDD